MPYKYLIVFITILLFSCKSKRQEKAAEICCVNTFTQKIEKVSLSDIDRIKSLHGKLAEVEGFYRSAFEESALCPSPKAIWTKCLWINNFDSVIGSDNGFEVFNNKKVVLIGEIDTRWKGHLGGYIAEVNNIVCIREIK